MIKALRVLIALLNNAGSYYVLCNDRFDYFGIVSNSFRFKKESHFYRLTDMKSHKACLFQSLTNSKILANS